MENQIERATEAKRLYHKVGAPTIENFKYLIKGNMIKNCPVTVDDINIMHKIWGDNIAYLNGKTA